MNNFTKAMNDLSFRRIEQSHSLIEESEECREITSRTDELFANLIKLLTDEQAVLLREHSDLISVLPLLFGQKVYEVAFHDGIQYATRMGAIDNAKN
ncbi:hypothetical protein [Listeria seeligeri]|uniref:hypothetical protein n=1 Tax=Listeria seeligeri TaxID=1640 RepID=UPI0022EBD397|nr:hypothetical protein [Listeria seeligeri]